ncbi:glycosyltransferase family 2 protein [Gluconacetobacter sp. 1c LMG 22058]|uniref:Glycosyltransferase family 2 protein n=1 Tax=Gluconacetobacter dulcium TaxID=2729096 RepID=A0A7W4JZM3_9PROT|nr:glycosyltransferase family 2 protein [Gluconacetobacter dulcium]MBB2197653.1 glycosyltransferase family 2 protein [Gluconacetobacter dulcium]
MQIDVSIVLTTYNSEKFIKETINCILNQNYHNYEVIIIDDNSTDNTREIISSIEDKKISYVVFNKKNMGAGYSRNVGLFKACGEYIIFLDDDDLYHPDMVGIAFGEAKRKELDILVFGSIGRNKKTNTDFHIPGAIRKDLLPQKPVFSALNVKKDVFHCMTWWCWDKIIKRSAIMESGIRFQEIRTTNDLFFMASMFLYANRISFIEKKFVIHVFDREGSLSNTRNKSYNCVISALRSLFLYMNGNNIFHTYRESYYNYCINFLLYHIFSLKGDDFCCLYKESVLFFDEINLDFSCLYDQNTKIKYLNMKAMEPVDYLLNTISETKEVIDHLVDLLKKQH